MNKREELNHLIYKLLLILLVKKTLPVYADTSDSYAFSNMSTSDCCGVMCQLHKGCFGPNDAVLIGFSQPPLP